MTDEEGFDNTGAPTTPVAPKRHRGPNRPKTPASEGGRKRRTSSQSKLALALVETHLAGVYSQMTLLEKAIAELKSSLS